MIRHNYEIERLTPDFFASRLIQGEEEEEEGGEVRFVE